MLRSVVFSTAMLLSAAAFADIKEWETVFEQDAWRLDVNIWDDDSLSCESRAVNDDGIVLRYESWPDGMVTLSLYKETWQFPSDSVIETYNLRIDQSEPWEVTGDKYDSSVTSDLDPTEEGVITLLDAMAHGKTLFVESSKGTEITRFHLAGFGPTLGQHRECEARITGTAPSQKENASARKSKESF
jgi:hypothetical protein